ncbi:Ref family recombination enhancement nuclease [Herbaspirillum sp. SJZ107]|uniref:Ref family recombination enhancement nuclease n=1 Tax=Herbaspirillum sp. SJZ107 TaxID=2572881 RepID=UPI00116A8C17|nr:Ref family recombination enhancement nuclease [Herbaspirillum sp. SJZ107]TQK10220.1 phage RecA-dependent nuclease [Herbaspirillum sp. SJZ107]
MMRRSPLKQGKPLQRKKAMSRGAGFSRAGTKTPAAGAGLLRVAAVRVRETKTPKLAKPMKSRGMKGRPPTAEEARFMDRMGKLPCIACLKDGWTNKVISLHHIDGRTKPGAHFLVLPLCGPHHQQDDSDPRQRISLHGRKKPFQARYGTERDLLAECIEKLKEQGDVECVT